MFRRWRLAGLLAYLAVRQLADSVDVLHVVGGVGAELHAGGQVEVVVLEVISKLCEEIAKYF